MIEALLHASVRGLVVGGLVWAACRFVPSLPPPVRTWLWWTASASFLVALCWTTPIAIEVLPPPTAVPDSAALAAVSSPRPPVAGRDVGTVVRTPASPVPDVRGVRVGWRAGAVVLWLTGVWVSVVMSVFRWRTIRRLVRTADPAPPPVEAIALDLAVRLGMPQAPPVRVHHDAEVPLVVGLWRPVVLLPASLRDESADAVRMAIGHELAHVRRRDLWLGLVPALVERLFFFHPLARIAASEYALSREAACDAVVIDTLQLAPARYGEWLLELGVTPRVTGLAGTAASGSVAHLRRRLAMLSQPARWSGPSRPLAVSLVALMAVVVVPWRLAARQAEGAGPDAAAASPAALVAPATAGRDAVSLDVAAERTGAANSAVTAGGPSSGDTSRDTAAERAPTAATLRANSPVRFQSIAPALQPCPTTTPVHARAPDDPNASPVTGWWHMSEDKALWVPSPPPGEATIGIGRYWVRPAGQGVTVRGRRLDGDAPPVLMVEREDSGYWTSGFFFGGPSIPTEGCWEFQVASGPSRVTFVAEIHSAFEAFAIRPQTRVTFEREVGRIESGGARLIVTAIVVEDPATRTRRLGGARLELQDATRTATLHEPFERLEGTRGFLERAAAGQLPRMVYGIGRTHNITDGEFLTIRGQGHTFRFGTHTHVDAARLLVAAGDDLRAQLR